MCRLLDWSQCGFETYLSTKTWRQRDLLQKKAGVIAYMFEALYDLMLALKVNVSRSPGFEALLPGGGQVRTASTAPPPTF